eukprot:COSAG01_NODE_1254_length_11042_cov_37.493192_6_plen_392_part_00
MCDVVSFVLVTMTAFGILGDTDRAYVTQVAAVATLFLWFRMFHYLSGVKATSHYVEIFVKMNGTIAVFTLFILFFVVGNAFSLELFFPDTGNFTQVAGDRSVSLWEQAEMLATDKTTLQRWWDALDEDRDELTESFGSIWNAIFTSFNIMLQSVDATLLRHAYSPWLTKVCYTVYSMLSNVVMLNMLVRHDCTFHSQATFHILTEVCHVHIWQIAAMLARYTAIDRDITQLQYRQRAKLILAYELEGADIQIAPTDTGEKEKQIFHFLHFFKNQTTWQDGAFHSCTAVGEWCRSSNDLMAIVRRAGNDKIESAWTNGSDRKLDEVQQNVARLKLRSKQRYKELDTKVEKMDEEMKESMALIYTKVEKMDEEMKESMALILDAVQKMSESKD